MYVDSHSLILRSLAIMHVNSQADAVFVPSVETMYPTAPPRATYVDQEGIEVHALEAQSRPGFFRG